MNSINHPEHKKNKTKSQEPHKALHTNINLKKKSNFTSNPFTQTRNQKTKTMIHEEMNQNSYCWLTT